jgi:dipeptidase E
MLVFAEVLFYSLFMIFLTSSISGVAGHLYENFLKEKGYSSVLFIDTAAELQRSDDAWLHRDLQSLADQGYSVDRYTVTDKTFEEIERVIDAHDIIYMCGGDTAYLLQQLQITKSFDLIKQKVFGGKPYIGTSAGSIICGTRLPDYFREEDRDRGLSNTEGFNFVNFTIIPHWGDEYFKERYIGKRLESVYKDTQDPLLLLTDRQYVQVLEGWAVRIITT